MIPILAANSFNIKFASEAILASNLIAFPTETVYGLGANGFDALAMAKIFEVKQRPFFDPLILHISDISMLDRIWKCKNRLAEILIEKFWPGPLTLVLPKHDRIPDLASSGLPTVAVRMPNHPIALELIRQAGVPLAAPSANPFGRLSPTSALHVQRHFEAGIEGILDGGPCSVGVESTILSLVNDKPILLRAGGIAKEDLEACIGPIAIAAKHNPSANEVLKGSAPGPMAPGQLEGHYAPRTRLYLIPQGADQNILSHYKNLFLQQKPPVEKPKVSPERESPIGYLAFSSLPTNGNFTSVKILSTSGDLREGAANLFSALHELDQMGLEGILAEAVPEVGLGLAIMDRLKKAEAGSRSGFQNS